MDQKVEPFKTIDEKGFRLFLQGELVRRCRSNPRYSLRAFAKTLAMEPSALSKIMRGERTITKKTFSKFAERLGLTPEETLRWLQDANSAQTSPTDINFQLLAADQFHAIADWYHFAMLELISVKNFQPNLRWIASCLGITVAEAQAAKERLERLGLLKITDAGKWIDVSDFVTNIGGIHSTTAMRQMQQQILQLAMSALENVGFEDRDQTSMTMAIDSSLLPEARDKIKRFRRDLCKFLQAKPEQRDEVFQMSVSLFPVSHARARHH